MVVGDVKKEQQEKARPKIKNKIENIDEYETIYIGYPNWWGEMPMILYTFFEDYDLSNKTIALFCTSGESGLSAEKIHFSHGSLQPRRLPADLHMALRQPHTQ